MKRVIFWLITLAVIAGAYLTFPRSDTLPRAYALLAPPANSDSADAIALGHEIFLANCVPCHGMFGNGQGTVKPPYGPMPADFTDRTKIPIRTPQYLFWRISEGGQVEPFRSQGSVMPAWKFQLSEERRWQLAAYVQTLSR